MRPFFFLILVGGTANAQTPPIRPNTQDVPAFPGFTLPTVPSELGSEPLTAEEAVKIAFANNPALQAEIGRRDAAKARAQQAEAGFLPRLNLNYTGTEATVLRGDDVTPGGGLGFRSNGAATVTQLLFDFGRARAFARQQRSLAHVAEHGFRQTLNDLALSVRTLFYGLARAQKLEEVSASNLANRNSQLALAQARLDSGLGAPADFVRAKNSVAEATIALTNARAAAIAAKFALALDLGVDPRTPITLAESTEPVEPADIDALVTAALESRPDVQEAKSAIAASGHAISFARQSNSPTINLFATFSTRGTEDPLLNQTGSFGVTVNWPLSDGGAGAARVREARANLLSAKSALESLLQGVVADVVQASVDAQAAEQRLQTAEVQIANARELVRISTGRYSGGIGLFTELTDAQDALFAAERNLASAQADLQIARAALRRAIGAV
jgi:outer membrane protein TolC